MGVSSRPSCRNWCRRSAMDVSFYYAQVNVMDMQLLFIIPNIDQCAKIACLWAYLFLSLSLSFSRTFSTLPYCIHRIGESFGVEVNFDPKPQKGDWNGAGCHTNFCIKPFHEDGGYESVVKAIKRLEKKHLEHIKVYGEGNERRLTGRHETAPIDKFSWGVAHRGASIRVPR